MSERRLGLLAGAVALLAACGGASRSEFIQRADGICSEADRQLKAAGRLPNIDIRYATREEMPAAAAYVDRVLPIFQAESARLHQLGDPSEDEGRVHDVLMFFDHFVDRVQEAGLAAHHADAQMFTPTLLRGLGAGVQAEQIAMEFGFRVCGRLPALAP